MDDYSKVAIEINHNNLMGNEKEYIFVDDSGKVLNEVSFSYITHSAGVLFLIYRCYGKQANIINILTGELLWKEWYSILGLFYEGYCIIKRDTCNNNKFNFINEEGKILFNEWFICATGLTNGRAVVLTEKYEWFIVDTEGNYKHCTNEEFLMIRNNNYTTPSEANVDLFSKYWIN